MDQRKVLIKMLKQLLEDMAVVQQQGAGYYTCIPVARRYNKLLNHAKSLFPDTPGLIATFDEIPEEDPKDPGKKFKVMQGIRVEIGQLMSMLRALGDDEEN
jgi:hypothetical protein